MDVTQYLEIFLDETKEHLQSLSDQFMILEQEPDNMDTINEIFRSAHTLKGMADVVLGWFGTSWNEVWTSIKTFFVDTWDSIADT